MISDKYEKTCAMYFQEQIYVFQSSYDIQFCIVCKKMIQNKIYDKCLCLYSYTVIMFQNHSILFEVFGFQSFTLILIFFFFNDKAAIKKQFAKF